MDGLTARRAFRTFAALARGAIAQLGERLHGMQEVGGSIPPGSTNDLRAIREDAVAKDVANPLNPPRFR